MLELLEMDAKIVPVLGNGSEENFDRLVVMTRCYRCSENELEPRLKDVRASRAWGVAVPHPTQADSRDIRKQI